MTAAKICTPPLVFCGFSHISIVFIIIHEYAKQIVIMSDMKKYGIQRRVEVCSMQAVNNKHSGETALMQADCIHTSAPVLCAKA